MNVYIIIPARYNSSRFPGKPLILINGLPMINYVIKQANLVTGIKLVAVATDDERIAQVVKKNGGQVIMTNSNLRTGSDRVAAAAQILGINKHDVVINVQGDQPLLPPTIISELVSPFLREPEITMSTPITTILKAKEINNPNYVKVVINEQNNALYFSRQPIPFYRDNKKKIYYKHLGIYAYRKSFLDKFSQLPSGRLELIENLEQLRAIEAGYFIRCVSTKFDSPEVDLPKDIKQITKLLKMN